MTGRTLNCGVRNPRTGWVCTAHTGDKHRAPSGYGDFYDWIDEPSAGAENPCNKCKHSSSFHSGVACFPTACNEANCDCILFADPEDEISEFEQELTALINKHSIEGASDTPDFILAGFIMNSLKAFKVAVGNRDGWYGYTPCAGREREEYTREHGNGQS